MTIRTRIAALITAATSLTVLAPHAPAQYASFTGSHVQDTSGIPLANGTTCSLAAENLDASIKVNVGRTIGNAMIKPVCSTIFARGYQVADPATSFSANLPYRITLADLDSSDVTVYKQVANVGPAFSSDSYLPPYAGTLTPFVYQSGPAGPAGPGTITGLSSDGASGIGVAGAIAAGSGSAFPPSTVTYSPVSGVLNGLNAQYDYQHQQGGAVVTGNTANGVFGGVSVPTGSAAYQADGVAGFANTHSAATNTVGVFGQCIAYVDNSNCWGLNSITTSYPGHVNSNNATDHGSGMALAGLWNVAITNPPNGYQVGIPSCLSFPCAAGNKWNGAFYAAAGSSYHALVASPSQQGTPANVESLDILLQSTNSMGGLVNSIIKADGFGNFQFMPGGGVSQFNGNAVVSGLGNNGYRLSPAADVPANVEIYGTNAAGNTVEWSIEQNGTATLGAGTTVGGKNPCLQDGTNCQSLPQPITFGTPSTSSATCAQGQVEFDAAYLYTCVAANTWRRAATSTF